MRSQYTYQLHRWVGRTQTCSSSVSFFFLLNWKKQGSNWFVYELWKTFFLNSEVMNQLSDFAKNMTAHSAEINVGKGVSAIIVKERHATDVKQVTLAYAAPSASPNVGAWFYLILIGYILLTLNCPVCDKRHRKKPCCAIDHKWCYVKYRHRVDFACFLTCTFGAMTYPPKSNGHMTFLVPVDHWWRVFTLYFIEFFLIVFFFFNCFCLIQFCIMNGTDLRVGKISIRV